MDRRSRSPRLEDKVYEVMENENMADTNSKDGSGKRKFDLAALLKKNPQRTRIGVAAAVLLVLAAVLVWSFGTGGSDKKGRRSGTPSDLAAQPAPVSPDMMDDEEDSDEASSGEGDAQPGVDAPDSSVAEEGDSGKKPEEAPPLPEDVTLWTPDDFQRARREGDARLIEAVGHLGAGSVGKEAVVAALTVMLAPLAPEEPAEPTEGQEGQEGAMPGVRRGPIHHAPSRQVDDGKLAEAVVEALAANDTEAAREVLGQIIAGKRSTEGDETRIVEAALKALAERNTPGNESLLFRMLTAADQFRPSSGAAVGSPASRPGVSTPGQTLSAEWLRGQVLSLVEKTASSNFRIRLGEFLVQPTTPLAWRAEMGKFLLEPHVDNLGVQFVVYQSGRMEQDVRTRIEEHFAARSTQAMAAVLGVPQEAARDGRSTGFGRAAMPPAGGAAAPDAEQDPELPFRLARQLWGERCTSVFIQQLADLDRRDDKGHLAAICATMPVETVRNALLKTLKSGQGPEVLEKAGIPGAMVSDPGLLLVVKSLDRQEPQAAPAGRGGRGTAQPAPGRTGGTVAQNWMKFSETLVRSWCERLDAAALANAEAARLAGKNPDEMRRLEDLPVELHDGAVAGIRSAYHLVIPGSLAEKLSGAAVGPMRIQYVRIEERTTMKRTLGYYRRAARVRDGRTVDDGVWIDTYRSAAAPGVRCSMDILIRPRDKNATRDPNPDAEETMIIEILSIEARELQL